MHFKKIMLATAAAATLCHGPGLGPATLGAAGQ